MDHLIAAVAARRFHLDGASKTQIATELGVSRFKVARILEDALRDGVVKIDVVSPAEIDLDASEAVAERFGVRQVLVVRTADGDRAARDRQLGAACAAVLAGTLSDSDVLGVSWGRTLHALVDVLPPLPRADVVQMVGSVPTALLTVNSLELVRRLGQCTGGEVHALHVPLAVPEPVVAAGLRRVEHVRATTSAFATITHAVVGIGSWAAGGSALRDALPDHLVDALRAAGAVADVCATVFDQDGVPLLAGDLEAHCLAITGEQLMAVPTVTGMAGGVEKAHAIAAVVRSGVLQRLIIDQDAAHALLDLP